MSHEYRLPGFSDLVLERDVPARMRDGTTLYADVYRPTSGGPFPVILMRLPYDKAQAANVTYRHPSWYARQGYIVVVQDARGRWRSEGDFYPFVHEAEDGYDTVEWAASLPRSNGRVGMYGFSYDGATQLQSALMRPPSLQTICPGFTGSQYYEGWAYNSGAFALAFNASWATNLAMDDARRQGNDAATQNLLAAFLGAPSFYSHLPLKAYPPLVGSDFGQYFFDWIDHPSYDDYWRRWSIDEDYSRIDVPALHISGWYDAFIGGTVKNFEGLRQGAGSKASRAAQKLLVGPWYHLPWSRLTGEADFGPQARNVVDDWQLRWFDRFLRDEDTEVLASPVTIFLMGENRWMEESTWPPEGSEQRDYYLRSGGSANSINGDGELSLEPPGREPPDVYTYDPLFPIPSSGGHSGFVPLVAPMGPADQAGVEVLNGMLVYTSAPLEEDLTVIGPISFTLYAATSAPDTDFTAKLCVVSPEGQSTNIQEGIVRARYRESLSHPTPISPDEVYEYKIDLGPTAYVFKTGQQIRVQVSSSNFPQWDRNLNTGGPLGAEGATQALVATQTVLHDANHPSCLTLPVASD